MAVGTIDRDRGQRARTRFSGASSANSAVTVSTDAVARRRLLYVTVAYSAAPTQTGVVVTLNSGIGAAYDSVLTTGTANAQYTNYIPAIPIDLFDNDAIDVLAPAAGGAITGQVVIVTEDISE